MAFGHPESQSCVFMAQSCLFLRVTPPPPPPAPMEVGAVIFLRTLQALGYMPDRGVRSRGLLASLSTLGTPSPSLGSEMLLMGHGTRCGVRM